MTDLNADGELSVSAAGADGADASLVAARVAGNVGDVLGGLDEASVTAGRLAGRVEVLLWCQEQIQLSLRVWSERDRFADLRAMEELLATVRDSLAAVQDGSGNPAGLVRTDLAAYTVGGSAVEGVPSD
jgi:hypothetical protein